MRCPYCKNKYEGLIFIFNTRCVKCGKKASNYNKKRYSLVSCVNIILALLIYALLNNYFGIFKNYIVLHQIISFVIPMIFLGILQAILLANIDCKRRRKRKNNNAWLFTVHLIAFVSKL